ncbi:MULTISPECIES: H-type small acid-soluble spore protein [Bacillales]|uniref:Small acid-soluble spore protein n=1 Tax=Brevibacillus brevis (strain 47 / JCM 6285 / NBRC 100599) TaxID=358681 RepID=C0Z6N5_BREBN|nr:MULTISPECIES: H-type small acid-soluble spore protein [Bacillales]KMZ44079.1 spore protein [Bacillus sp. FJAT-27238]MBH0329794.1 spore protein [Brevibacillus brevis]NQF16404.1 H-type small acid-soluble spore protein [Brevibacillus sp. HB1.3]NRR06191.1 H-type small acid-soluble spore protein [Brevibacillus sp. RS1.1]NRS52101.1 H-type small acid-soluble spore protein [Brevibacillus sp. HB2.2]
MNVTRAQAIMKSDDHIKVEYDGQAVWIDAVDEKTSTARVHEEKNPGHSRTVYVSQLMEVSQ